MNLLKQGSREIHLDWQMEIIHITNRYRNCRIYGIYMFKKEEKGEKKRTLDKTPKNN